MDPDEAKLPESVVRHAETLILYDLALEMGEQVHTGDITAMTKAEVFLRLLRSHGFLIAEDSLASIGPSYKPGPGRATL